MAASLVSYANVAKKAASEDNDGDSTAAISEHFDQTDKPKPVKKKAKKSKAARAKAKAEKEAEALANKTEKAENESSEVEEAPPKPVYVDAPIPKVNPWTLRASKAASNPGSQDENEIKVRIALEKSVIFQACLC